MRLFIAIELPEAVRLKLARLSRYLQEYWKEKAYPKTSWVHPENLHLTLKFLGEVAETEVPRICDQLRSIQTPGPINVWPDRIECLPPNGPIRVIGAGLMGDLARLGELHQEIEEPCAALGFARERRKYRAHITLARLRDCLPSNTRKQLTEAAASHFPAGEMRITEIVLMQSHLHPQGSQYVPLARFALARTVRPGATTDN